MSMAAAVSQLDEGGGKGLIQVGTSKNRLFLVSKSC